MTDAADLTVFQDYDRYIIGARSDQTCLSMTTGVAEAYTLKAARAALQRAREMSAEELLAAKQTYWTDGRFEAACDKGKFGVEW